MKPEQSVSLITSDILLVHEKKIGEVYPQCKDEDGFLYILYSVETSSDQKVHEHEEMDIADSIIHQPNTLKHSCSSNNPVIDELSISSLDLNMPSIALDLWLYTCECCDGDNVT